MARAVHRWFRGWAEAQLGDPRAGYRLIREGYEQAVRLGIRAWASETLGYAAEALARAGDWIAARRELDEAMQCADAIGEREYLTQLLLLDARIADALGEPDRARESMRQAVAEARAQEAAVARADCAVGAMRARGCHRQGFGRAASRSGPTHRRSRYGAGRKGPGIAQEDSE